ncbi:mitochondrial arginine transporter BAC2-like [Benincasa hispida]|uniref:mitochondrial arginine transporter BAC2-like n=1 Tax=Benincasa hispida TaxID=102211 RepID=UPI001900C8B2|nr:mitochondrial arginine transporter BAC2-like [Benincasa hispida]
MDFWPEFLANSWGREFVAGGFGGIAGIISGYPLDTLRVRQQQSVSGSALKIFRNIIANDGPAGLYRGMAAPLASVTFQNAAVFQIYAVLSRAFNSSSQSNGDPPSYKAVAFGGVGTGALQSFILTPVELVKIRLQLQSASHAATSHQQLISSSSSSHRGPLSVAKSICKTEGLRGIYRGLTITMLRDAPAHGIYFWTYECMREQFHPGCRKTGQESVGTMLVAGGLAGVASWVFCYPLDVLKTRIQGQTQRKYNGIVDCLSKSVREEGYRVLWRGLGTAVARAFVVNGAIFSAYEITLRCLFSSGSNQTQQ